MDNLGLVVGATNHRAMRGKFYWKLDTVIEQQPPDK